MEKEIAILKVRDKVFVNEKGEEIPYKDCFITLDGQDISLYPSKNKKEIFKYLLNKELESMGD